jgi:hypothetical protein
VGEDAENLQDNHKEIFPGGNRAPAELGVSALRDIREGVHSLVSSREGRMAAKELKMKMAAKGLVAMALALLLCSCTSPEDKSRIRLAASAFDRAYEAGGRNEELMVDLQKAVDAIQDADARAEFLRCKNLLTSYNLAQRMVVIAYERNLIEIGHGRQSTAKDAEIAMSKAKLANPLPDLQPLANCDVVSLPSFAK